jgi:pyruvate dehydrogenase E2 component (dihydrolipoamide acetyltransferase)
MLRFRPELETDRRVPLTRNRRAIASLMTASAAVPQFSVDANVDLTELAAGRAAGTSFSYGDAVARAATLALIAHPELNTSFDGDCIVRHGNVHMGMGTLGPDGLLVVVVRNAERLTLEQLASERRRLANAAEEGSLRGDEVLGATFVVSNLGPAGVPHFQALVVPPVAAILAIGAVDTRLRLVDEQVRAYPALTLCLSCDHRVVDGMDAARFLGTLVRELEQPVEIF